MPRRWAAPSSRNGVAGDVLDGEGAVTVSPTMTRPKSMAGIFPVPSTAVIGGAPWQPTSELAATSEVKVESRSERLIVFPTERKHRSREGTHGSCCESGQTRVAGRGER